MGHPWWASAWAKGAGGRGHVEVCVLSWISTHIACGNTEPCLEGSRFLASLEREWGGHQ